MLKWGVLGAVGVERVVGHYRSYDTHVLYALAGSRHCDSCFTQTISIHLFPSSFSDKSHYHPCFTDEVTEDQRGQVAGQASDFRASALGSCTK